jgi:hypothetical protein
MMWVWCLIISQPAPAASRTISLATARSPPWLMPISAMTKRRMVRADLAVGDLH